MLNLSILTFSTTLIIVTAKIVTFSNVLPRLDSSGAILKAHDGTTQRFPSSANPSLFYYHAMGYPNCSEPGKINGCTNCIYGRNNSMAVYSSPDLSSGSWKLEESIYPGNAGFPSCTYFRTQSVYNAKTNLFVLWANTAGCDNCPPGGCAAYATATSPAPGGPYTFQTFTQPSQAQLGNKSGFIGDYALRVDDDGSAYIILTHGIAGAGHRDMYIFKLSDDFLQIEQSGFAVGPLPGPHLVEAPALFKRGSIYYALLGGCTCMGLYGGGVAVLTAPSMGGPWTNVTSTLDPGCPMEKQSTCFEMGPGAICNPVTQAQQNYVITVPLSDGTEAYIWTGDKWQTSPDGSYDEQPQTWLPLSFDADGNIQPFVYVDTFSLDVADSSTLSSHASEFSSSITSSSSSLSSSSPISTLSATSSMIQWTGRTVRNMTEGTVSFDWESIQGIFSVTNTTSIWATLSSTFWASPPVTFTSSSSSSSLSRSLQQSQFPKFGVYRVYVNGTRIGQGEGAGSIVVMPGQNEYLLVADLDPTMTYTIILWYTTDPVFNSWPDLDQGVGCYQKVISFRTDGSFTEPPPLRAKSMLIIGDSITSGNAMYLPCDNATKCDSSQSYAGLLCEAFSLNCTQLTASSKGLVNNCCDSLKVNVPVLANRTFAQDNSTLWDWSLTPFDAILVNLGTNDGSKTPPNVFTAAYFSLLKHLVQASKINIPIFASYGPISDLSAPWIKDAAAEATAIGMNVTLIDFMAAPLDGCGHPGVKGHPAMARIAAPVISSITGWEYNLSHFPN